MKNTVLPIADWFRMSEWPWIPCTNCHSGMSVDRKNIVEVQDAESARWMDHPDFEPEWVYGKFHGVITCGNSRCGTRMIIVGEYRTVIVDDPTAPRLYHNQMYDQDYKIRFTDPPIPIMELPEGAPETVRNLVLDASRFIWVDPSGAVGRLRVALEALMDSFRIKKLGQNRKPMFLDARLQLFANKKPEIAEFLLAVKWIGNAGAHGASSLDVAHVLDAADLMEHSLKMLYDKSADALKRRAAAINKAKRPLSTRKK